MVTLSHFFMKFFEERRRMTRPDVPDDKYTLLLIGREQIVVFDVMLQVNQRLCLYNRMVWQGQHQYWGGDNAWRLRFLFAGVCG